jgi:hypothetical protein
MREAPVYSLGTQETNMKISPVSPTPTNAEGGVARVAISSVQISDDCPDPVAAAPAMSPSQAPASRPPPSDSSALYDAGCLQSTIQIAFAAQGESQIALREVRLMTPEGKTLGTIAHRLPTMWQDNSYVTWDEVLPENSDLKAAYKITPPNWQEVEKVLGSSSYGAMFVIEADFEIGGVTTTLRSNQIAREDPSIMPT